MKGKHKPADTQPPAQKFIDAAKVKDKDSHGPPDPKRQALLSPKGPSRPKTTGSGPSAKVLAAQPRPDPVAQPTTKAATEKPAMQPTGLPPWMMANVVSTLQAGLKHLRGELLRMQAECTEAWAQCAAAQAQCEEAQAQRAEADAGRCAAEAARAAAEAACAAAEGVRDTVMGERDAACAAALALNSERDALIQQLQQELPSFQAERAMLVQRLEQAEESLQHERTLHARTAASLDERNQAATANAHQPHLLPQLCDLRAQLQASLEAQVVHLELLSEVRARIAPVHTLAEKRAAAVAAGDMEREQQLRGEGAKELAMLGDWLWRHTSDPEHARAQVAGLQVQLAVLATASQQGLSATAAAMRQLQAENDVLAHAVEQSRAELTRVQDAHSKRVAQLELKLVAAQGTTATLLDGRATAQAEADAARAKVAALEQEQLQLHRDREVSRALADQARADLGRVQQEADQVRKEHQSLTVAHSQVADKYESARAELEKLQLHQQALRDVCSQATAACVAAKAEVEKLTAQCAAAVSACESAYADAQEHAAECTAARQREAELVITVRGLSAQLKHHLTALLVEVQERVAVMACAPQKHEQVGQEQGLLQVLQKQVALLRVQLAQLDAADVQPHSCHIVCAKPLCTEVAADACSEIADLAEAATAQAAAPAGSTQDLARARVEISLLQEQLVQLQAQYAAAAESQAQAQAALLQEQQQHAQTAAALTAAQARITASSDEVGIAKLAAETAREEAEAAHKAAALARAKACALTARIAALQTQLSGRNTDQVQTAAQGPSLQGGSTDVAPANALHADASKSHSSVLAVCEPHTPGLSASSDHPAVFPPSQDKIAVAGKGQGIGKRRDIHSQVSEGEPDDGHEDDPCGRPAGWLTWGGIAADMHM